MSDRQFVTCMLSWRQALHARHPKVAAAIEAEWKKWLHRQRTSPPTVSKPLLIVSVEVSCIEDLGAHVGLAQILSLSTVRCALILIFPNEAVARIARRRAWREGWDGLVEFAQQDHARVLLGQLPADSPLLHFSAPAILSRALMDGQFEARHHWRMSLPASKETGASAPLLAGSAYFGRSGDFSAWVEEQGEEDWPALMKGLDLLGSDEVDLGRSPAAELPRKRKAWSLDAVRPVGAAANLGEDAVKLPKIGTGDELIVRTARDPYHPTVIQRRPARLLPPGQCMGVRLPGGMLGPAPRMVRVEAHQADGTVLGDNLLVQVRPSDLKPWMISCFLNRGGGGNPVVRAFANAIDARLAYAEDEPEVLQDIPVVWGVLRESDRILAQAKAQSLYFFYIDHAYFDRGHRRSYRITRNGYEAGAIRRCPSDRRDELGLKARPWRKSGKEIIVCPPTDYFMEAHGCSDWLEKTLGELKSFTDRPIVVREKPKEGDKAVALPTALKTAHALVTHSSNVAIEAVCLGTPVFVAPTSAAAPVGRTDLSQIEQPVYPDRDAWLAHLAYSQYSFEEIEKGRAWQMLLELEERELA